MSAIYQVRPLADFTIFTTPAGQRKPIRFDASWAATQSQLRSELKHLDASEAILELAVQPRHIRQDGELRADVPKDLPHPGVRLSFRSKHGPLSYTCDTYAARYYGQMPDWQANLRAIVLTLEALRAVDRYGALKGEQYVGSRALPAGSGATPMGGMTRDQAIAVLAGYTDVPPEHLNLTPESLHSTWRVARRRAHPDHNGGDQTKWDQVEQAASVLGISS